MRPDICDCIPDIPWKKKTSSLHHYKPFKCLPATYNLSLLMCRTHAGVGLLIDTEIGLRAPPCRPQSIFLYIFFNLTNPCFLYLRIRANLREESRCKTKVRLIISELKKVNPSLSSRALGIAIRRAFPAVVRRKVGPVYYYFGLKLTSEHSEGEVSSSKSQNDVADPIRNEIAASRDLPGKGT